MWIPRGSCAEIGRQRGGVASVLTTAAHAVSGIGQLQRWDAEPRHSQNVTCTPVCLVRKRRLPDRHMRHPLPVQQSDLLVERHLLDNEIGAFVGGEGLIHPRLLGETLGKHAASSAQGKQNLHTRYVK